MISVNLKRIAADSNVILSACLGKRALRIFTETGIEVITTAYNIEEVEEYLPHLALKYGLNPTLVNLQLTMLPLLSFPGNYYKAKVSLAKKYIGQRDPEDIHLLALAIKEEVPIWSNDGDFKDSPVHVYPTAKLLAMCDL